MTGQWLVKLVLMCQDGDADAAQEIAGSGWQWEIVRTTVVEDLAQ